MDGKNGVGTPMSWYEKWEISRKEAEYLIEILEKQQVDQAKGWEDHLLLLSSLRELFDIRTKEKQ
jgi:hypothetical protein